MELKKYQFWFCTGSQDLYGDECLAKVAQHSKQIVDKLNKSGMLPYEVVWKPTLITNELIRKTFNEEDDEIPAIRQSSMYNEKNRARIDNNQFFESRSNPLSSKGN